MTRVLREKKQCLVFVHSRGDTFKTGEILIELMKESGTESLFQVESEHAVHRDVVNSRNAQLQKLVPFGIGMHNAGIWNYFDSNNL